MLGQGFLLSLVRNGNSRKCTHFRKIGWEISAARYGERPRPHCVWSRGSHAGKRTLSAPEGSGGGRKLSKWQWPLGAYAGWDKKRPKSVRSKAFVFVLTVKRSDGRLSKVQSYTVLSALSLCTRVPFPQGFSVNDIALLGDQLFRMSGDSHWAVHGVGGPGTPPFHTVSAIAFIRDSLLRWCCNHLFFFLHIFWLMFFSCVCGLGETSLLLEWKG